MPYKDKEIQRASCRTYNYDHLETDRLRHITRRYGISPAEYTALYDTQAGKCGICGRPAKRLCVDHNHQNGKVRGLLCVTCNIFLGTIEAVGIDPIYEKIKLWLK